MAILEINNVSYAYPESDKNAVRNFSFVLLKPGVIGLAGKNGSGKSTLLKCIYGLVDIQEGSVKFEGESVTGPSYNSIPGHPKMKLVDQNQTLEMEISVEENISRKLLEYQPAYRQEKTLFLLERTNLINHRKKQPRELSGGQQQILSICCALAEEPSLLLLDEPFVSLDAFARENAMEYLYMLATELQISMIMVSHDPRDLLAIADEIIVLKDGEKITQDQPESIFYFPKEEYTAGLFGPYSVINKGNDKMYFRPSEISITKKATGISALIEKKIFRGDFYEYFAEDENENLFVFYYPDGRFEPGDSVKLQFKKRADI